MGEERTLRPARPARPTPFDPTLLHTSADLARQGRQPHTGARGRAAGLHRVRHGVWMPAREWEQLHDRERHAALVHATALYADPGGSWVLSHAAAAAIWGLPRIGPWPSDVDVLQPGSRAGSSGRVRRHTGAGWNRSGSRGCCSPHQLAP